MEQMETSPLCFGLLERYLLYHLERQLMVSVTLWVNFFILNLCYRPRPQNHLIHAITLAQKDVVDVSPSTTSNNRWSKVYFLFYLSNGNWR